MEVWKDIPGKETEYQVSNLGRVRSLDRTVIRKNGVPDSKHGKVLSPGKTSLGYEFVHLGKDRWYVHRLVLLAFKGPSDKDVDHINNIKDDNKLENLRYAKKRINIARSRRNKTSKYTGVHYSKSNKKWKANITIEAKQYFLGYFTKEKEAYAAYLKALREWNSYSKIPN